MYTLYIRGNAKTFYGEKVSFTKKMTRLDFEKMTNLECIDLSLNVEMIVVEDPREIERITKWQYTGIPLLKRDYPHRRQTWHGDFARFIVANMVP